jgi:putative addiction module component (TIGR02574 family)
MSKVADDILTSAMQLPIIDRAEIASALLASLDGEPDDGVEAAWAAEIERRIERIKSGAAKGQPWAKVRKRLEQSRG